MILGKTVFKTSYVFIYTCIETRKVDAMITVNIAEKTKYILLFGNKL